MYVESYRTLCGSDYHSTICSSSGLAHRSPTLFSVMDSYESGLLCTIYYLERGYGFYFCILFIQDGVVLVSYQVNE